jgi:hypothetical protein
MHDKWLRIRLHRHGTLFPPQLREQGDKLTGTRRTEGNVPLDFGVWQTHRSPTPGLCWAIAERIGHHDFFSHSVE